MQNNVKVMRESLNLTQEQLANKAEVSRVLISNIESGKEINIKKDTMEKIAVKGLNSTIYDVFFNI